MTTRPTIAERLSGGPLGRLWRRLSPGPEPIASRAVLRAYLEERAALIAQKCAIDYCRGKTGLASYALFEEKTFIDALEICRWETFVLVLGDLIVVTEGRLRPHAAAGERSRLREALSALYAEALAGLSVPSHRAAGWDDVITSFELRFHAAGLASPMPTLDIADHSAKRLFETMPIHASMRKLDEEVVYGAVRFRMIAVSQEMERRFAAADLVRQLLAREAFPGGDAKGPVPAG